MADNSHNESIPPLSADFTFYGGIYREVSLVATAGIHFSMDDNGSKSVFVSTPVVSETRASISIKGNVTNKVDAKITARVSTIISGRENKTIAQISSILSAGANTEINFEQHIPHIKSPHLWSPEDPYLYTVTTTITDIRSGKVMDEIMNPLGFRWFHFDAAKGFFLNGKSYKLIGTSRHQDFKDLGNAVSKKMAREDLVLVKKAGFNFFRVAHYPQDPAVLQACDELGLLASVEIPLVNEITESEEFYRNCRNMQVEMIRQNYNHPSVIIWCYMNEIFLRPRYSADRERQKQYYKSIEKLAVSLDSITRKEDPYRYTMIANHADYNRYHEYKLTSIAMLTGWNLYSGWYSGTQEDFPAFLDRHHQNLPNQPFMITEYGADADPRIRSIDPLRFDKSVEYATRFHQYYISEIMKRPFVAGAVVWNLADFNSETRNETMPHINNKGLLTWDRIPKDPYLLYQAIFLKEPFIKIASSAWKLRSGIADSTGKYCYQPLQVASNFKEISLRLNGEILSTAEVNNGLAEWMLPFVDGENKIEVTGYKNRKKYSDVMVVNFQLQANAKQKKLPVFSQLNILLGAKRYFIDEKAGQLWIPDQRWQPGSWGSVGGRPFGIPNNKQFPYGTDRNITGTDNDPIYQTQQTAIEAYRFNVPAGTYELVMHFAELQGGVVRLPPYNLGDSSRDEKNPKRIFDITINGSLFLQRFDMAAGYGAARAIIKKTIVAVKNNDGITITFNPIEGEAVLNAIELKNLFTQGETTISTHD
jgi:beta-galactosidase